MNPKEKMQLAAEQIRTYPNKNALLYRLLGWFEACAITNPPAAEEFARAVETLTNIREKS